MQRRKLLEILLPILWSVPGSISITWVQEAGWRERVREGCFPMGVEREILSWACGMRPSGKKPTIYRFG